MENEEIIGIIKYINSLTFSEIEVETSDIKVKIKRDNGLISNDKPKINSNVDAPINVVAVSDDLPTIDAPISGLFYRSPAPDEPAFVEVGDRVSKGDTLCVLEAMKMMNEIKSDKNGVIKEIVPSDGDSVEESSTLFIFQGE